jgi:hypothetical protein
MIKYFAWLLFLFSLSPAWAGTLAIDVSKLSQTVNKIFTKPIKFNIWLYPKSTAITQAKLNIVGGKSQEENFGTGTNYILGGPGVTLVTHPVGSNPQTTRGSYTTTSEFTTATITIPPGAYSTSFTITPVNNKVPSMDQVLKIYLSDPSEGNKIVSNNLVSVKIYDDTIPGWNNVRNIVSVVDPNINFDNKAPFDRGIALSAKGDGVTDDTAAIQGVVDWVYAHGGGIVFFPGAHVTTTSPAVPPTIVRPINRNMPSIYANFKSALPADQPWELSLKKGGQ